jgi:trehalose utilization protein
MYFWFARTREGERLAKRVEEGMWLMIKDGTYDKIFNHYFKADLDRLNLKKRRVIKIVNPYLPSTTPLSDKRLWFSLQDI